jgi:hypothetical protein
MGKENMKRIFVLIIGAFLLGITFSAHSSSMLPDFKTSNATITIDHNQTRWAVFIGYSGGFTYWHQRIFQNNDIQTLKRLLLTHGWDEDHIRCFVEKDATKDAILNTSFAWLQGAGENDLIVYFVSMHGYYLPVDLPPIDEPDGKDERVFPYDPHYATWNWSVYIVDDEFAARFNTLKSHNIVIIFDTCHSGGMIDGSSDFGGSGRVVLTSCGVDEAACMFLPRLHWLFPYFLIQGLRGRADLNHDGFVSVEEALKYTERPVAFHSTINNLIFNHRLTAQHPQMSDGWPSVENNTEELKLIEL